MWVVKFYGEFVSNAKRNAASTFLQTRLAPGIGTLAPADRMRVAPFAANETGGAVSGGTLIFEYDTVPAGANLRTLWQNRSSLLDNAAGAAGCVFGVILVARLTGSAQPINLIYLATRVRGGAQVDAYDTDNGGIADPTVVAGLYPSTS